MLYNLLVFVVWILLKVWHQQLEHCWRGSETAKKNLAASSLKC